MTPLLPTRMVEKPWGRDLLPAPFVTPAGKRIGEVWFEPAAVLQDLLVKYIFTSEKLSVQVHPSDAQTLAAGLGRQGKEECWLVIQAEAGAALGIGFEDTIDHAAMRQAAIDGSIEDLMTWHPVSAGDFFYIPANTVHAIGAGISLIEVQQASDITYRLFDYGRPRELHLDEGIAVSSGASYPSSLRASAPLGTVQMLADGPYFRLDQVVGAPDGQTATRYAGGPLLVIPRSGTVEVDGEPVCAGQCGLAAAIDGVVVPEGVTCLLAQSIGTSRAEQNTR